MARHHKRHKGDREINLVSMIDMLTILVFFLLVYSAEEVEVLPSAKDVQLPQSMAEEHAHDAVVVIVTDTEIMMEGRSLGRIADILAADGVIIPALQTALKRSRRGDRRANGRANRESRSDDHGGQRHPISAAKEGHGDLGCGGLWSIVVGGPAEGVGRAIGDGRQKLGTRAWPTAQSLCIASMTCPGRLDSRTTRSSNGSHAVRC
jgi:hypothetical protein